VLVASGWCTGKKIGLFKKEVRISLAENKTENGLSPAKNRGKKKKAKD